MSAPITVRLTGDRAEVRRLVAALTEATSVTWPSLVPPGSTDTFLQVELPEEETVLVFDGLPPGGRKRYASKTDEERAVAELQARPGEWAHVASFPAVGSARQTASLIRRGMRSCYQPAGAFEAWHRPAQDDSGQWWVYARYVGGDAT